MDRRCIMGVWVEGWGWGREEGGWGWVEEGGWVVEWGWVDDDDVERDSLCAALMGLMG
jgi:hypothetical protein